MMLRPVITAALTLLACIASAQTSATQSLDAKTKSMILPEIAFRNAGITNIVAFFSQTSRELDTTQPAEKRGINFVLKATPEDLAKTPPVTMNARNISMLEALKIVTDLIGYKFRIHGNVVFIMPTGMPESDLESRTYTIFPTLATQLQNAGKNEASK